MGINIGRNMDFRHGTSQNTDIISVNNATEKSDDRHVEQMRQKVGTDFTADPRRSTGKKKSELGKDDFMKLMSAQLKYQDPINPMKNEEMAAQLAQFSALEQMMNVNNTLEKMVTGQKPSEHMLAASLIGKRVSTDSTHFQLEKGSASEINFQLPQDAQSVNVTIVDAKGEVVREIDLGELQKGEQSVRWDGKNGKFQDQPLGEYSYKITAADKDGKPIPISNDSSGIVSGVTFEGGKSVLLVGDRKVAIERVGRIEQDTPGAHATAAKPGPAAAGANPLAAATALDDKQISSSIPAAADEPPPTSPRVAKNNLPPELSPEKIKSMLRTLSAPASGDLAASSSVDPADTKVIDPLWNPGAN